MASSGAAAPYGKGPAEMLAGLVRDMESNPAEHRKQIRQLLDESPNAFLPAAVDVLRKQAETRGAQFVASLLVSSGLLLPALCDPSLSYEQALTIARLAMRADSTKDVMLGRASADRVASSRVIRILESSAGGKDFLPLLLRLLRQPNPYLRSKAVLMLARDTRNVNWVRKTLEDRDPRIRANAVEAIWGVDTSEARELLNSLRADSNNRVAGNALLGLYCLGDAAVIPEILDMATHRDPSFRATASWVMGETGHPRFLEVLADLLKDSNPVARRTALAALGRVHSAVNRARDLPVRRVAARFRKATSSGERRIEVAISARPGADSVPVLPTQIFLAEDGKAVNRYKFGMAAAGEQSSVTFLIPSSEPGTTSSWTRHVLACLGLKRPVDEWSCVPYASGIPQSGDVPTEEVPLPYASEEALIRENFAKTSQSPVRSDIWHALWRSTQAGKENQHLIICNDSPSDRAAGPGLVANLTDSASHVQVISSVKNPALESLCSQVNGSFLLGRSPAALPALVEQAYLNLQVHYEISYAPVQSQAKMLKVCLCHPAGWGEISIPVPRNEV